MPQVLKDEVRDKIVRTAERLFITRGYEKVSMSLIAKEAGMAVGNIYRYFSGKDMLYRYLAKPVTVKLMELFSKPMNSYNKEEIGEKILGFLEIYDSEKDLLFLLLENSHNSDFHNLKEDIINGFAEAVSVWHDNIKSGSSGKPDPSFIRAFTSAYVNGIISILAEKADEKVKRSRLFRFSTFMKDSLYREFMAMEGRNNECHS
ncbi:MAG: TetR/AcrR family transcriptional regulator [Clostridia bacterium]|nr:TetR/AcrR family transcriptional regulator [Clostridia bacterium]MBN2882128.1 TetR/AcrR family transcriptional regulator [Clostridia bacterium]